ncbi:MAG TPA: MFS transporter [Micromonosporaceae bacterium]|nr:MFS transporter [Micromonosporaceae bacterium]
MSQASTAPSAAGGQASNDSPAVDGRQVVGDVQVQPAAGPEPATVLAPAAIPAEQPLAEAVGRRNEWLLVIFTAATNTTDAITKVALPLLAAQLTSSPALVAGVLTALTLPWLVTALHVGVFVDRLNRRSLMVGAEVARIVAVGVILAAVLAGGTTILLIYVIAVVLGIAEVIALTAGASIVPTVVPRKRWQTANARITAMEYLFNGFVGSPIGGFLVAIGFAFTFGVTVGVYAIGIVLLFMLAANFAVKKAPVRRSMNAEIREGISFLWRYKLLRTMALLISVMAGCWAGWLAVLPVYAVRPGPLELTSQGYGILLTCLGAGGVLGTLMVGRTNRWLGRRWSMFADIIGTFMLVAVPAVVPATAGSAWAVGAAAFIAGVGGTMWTVNSRVIIQSLVPNELLGRFNAASRLLGWGTAPVAAALMGVLAEVVGFRAAFGVFAVLCAGLIVPYLRIVTAEALAPVDSPG